MSKEELRSKTVKELRELAKEQNITGRWSMTKEELVDAMNVDDLSDSDICLEGDCAIGKVNQVQPEVTQKVGKATRTTSDYLSKIDEGTLVAFKRKTNKEVAMSGKFVSFSGNKVRIASKKGTIYDVSPESIVWVKTGARWPKWVFAMFTKKEVAADETCS